MDDIKLETIVVGEMEEGSSDFLPFRKEEQYLSNDTLLVPDTLPILPLRNAVLFPGVFMPITIGRNKSMELVKEAYRKGSLIGCISQKDIHTENPRLEDMFRVGTVATILKVIEMPDGMTTVLIQGKKRFHLDDILYNDPYNVGKITLKYDEKAPENDPEYKAIGESLKEMTKKIVKFSSNAPNGSGFALKNSESILFLLNFVASCAEVDYLHKQALLETDDLKKRAMKMLEILNEEANMLELKNEIQAKAKTDMDKQQREYFLHQQ